MTIFSQKPYVLQSELDYDKKQSFCIRLWNVFAFSVAFSV